MKRLVFCFDGTWNKLDPALATNVVLTAASILRTDDDGVSQIIHYDEGVGTGQFDKHTGGAFGAGLIENVREAYRFLVFNYDPGDQIYVFGFSRGAFSARTFVGFLRHAGPLRRLHVGRIDEALDLYKARLGREAGSGDALARFRATYSDGVCIGGADDVWRCANVKDYAKGSAPEMRVQYMGVWDTVGALGWPGIVPGSSWLNREYRFHDASVDPFVASARHAVAIDERRSLFPSMSFGDLTKLNRDRGFEPSDRDAPYQERWFPGVHGSVGGGGDIRGLSDDALAWVLRGAKAAGLRLDTVNGTRINQLRPDPLAPLINEKAPAWSATKLVTTDRKGPEHLWQLSDSAVRRWRSTTGVPWRPKALASVRKELDALGPWTFVPPTDLLAEEIVKPGDTLGRYAVRHYGDVDLWPLIHAANEDTVPDPHDIFQGQVIRVPRLPERPRGQTPTGASAED